MVCFLNLIMMYFVEQKFLIITQYNLSVFSFMIIAFWVLFNKFLQSQDHEDILCFLLEVLFFIFHI